MDAKTAVRAPLTVLAVFNMTFCNQEKAVLEPATSATQPVSAKSAPASSADMQLTAVDSVQGVKVVLATQQWPGNQQVRNHVTPVKVTIHNNGKQPVMVRYGNFALDSGDGDRYAAIPPFKVEGEVEKPVLVGEYRFDPILDVEEYAIAPYLRSAYGYPVYTSTYYYDPYYYRTYYSYWGERDKELPTLEMLQRAIPEGVVKPAGKVSGFLYFDAVDADEQHVTFRGTLMNPDTGKHFGTVTMPLSVREANP